MTTRHVTARGRNVHVGSTADIGYWAGLDNADLNRMYKAGNLRLRNFRFTKMGYTGLNNLSDEISAAAKAKAGAASGAKAATPSNPAQSGVSSGSDSASSGSGGVPSSAGGVSPATVPAVQPPATRTVPSTGGSGEPRTTINQEEVNRAVEAGAKAAQSLIDSSNGGLFTIDGSFRDAEQMYLLGVKYCWIMPIDDGYAGVYLGFYVGATSVEFPVGFQCENEYNDKTTLAEPYDKLALAGGLNAGYTLGIGRGTFDLEVYRLFSEVEYKDSSSDRFTLNCSNLGFRFGFGYDLFDLPYLIPYCGLDMVLSDVNIGSPAAFFFGLKIITF